eukprot:SAG31_NODE_4986_length_2819_cov_2.012868_3_plen_52_part_00
MDIHWQVWRVRAGSVADDRLLAEFLIDNGAPISCSVSTGSRRFHVILRFVS